MNQACSSQILLYISQCWFVRFLIIQHLINFGTFLKHKRVARQNCSQEEKKNPHLVNHIFLLFKHFLFLLFF